MLMEIKPKQKITNRIEKEGLFYRENFTLSLTNQYEYCWNLSIYGPKFTDYSELEQTYCIAHELGHHYINKKMNPILLELLKLRPSILAYIIERLAWEKANIICEEESIEITNDFNILKNKCLDTYKKAIEESGKNIFKFGFDIFISYYKILVAVYLIYKCANEGVIDALGIFKYFKANSVKFITSFSFFMWVIYFIYKILKVIIVTSKGEK